MDHRRVVSVVPSFVRSIAVTISRHGGAHEISEALRGVVGGGGVIGAEPHDRRALLRGSESDTPHIEAAQVAGLRRSDSVEAVDDHQDPHVAGRQGCVVPYRTLHRFASERCGFGRKDTTVRVADGDPGWGARSISAN